MWDIPAMVVAGALARQRTHLELGMEFEMPKISLPPKQDDHCALLVLIAFFVGLSM